MSSRLDRRQLIRRGLTSIAGLAANSLLSPNLRAAESETLYNGIRLPSPWPPRLSKVPETPAIPSYLTSPPSVIPIDVGRQLFVDDFLVASTTLQRTHHRPTYYEKNPVLTDGMVYSDGVWHDPQDKLFKMWYLTKGGTAYATSKDGLAWEKPDLDVKKGSNLIQTSARLQYGLARPGRERSQEALQDVPLCQLAGEGLVVSVGPLLGGRHSLGRAAAHRLVRRPQHRVLQSVPQRVGLQSAARLGPAAPPPLLGDQRDDVVAGAQWGANSNPFLWCGSDRLDLPRKDYRITPELYNLDCVAYESILLGLFSIWRGQFPERPKPNEVCVGYSRDGWSWTRPDRRGFLPISETKGEWNYGNVQSAGGCCLVVGDRLFFYCSGRGTGNVTSLAVLRRDGFVSMDADDREGTLTTRPIRFRGKHLFVNLDAPAGELRVEVHDERGRVIAPYRADNCVPVRGNDTLQAVRWQEAEDLGRLAGKTVALRFRLRNGKLYAFWVSSEVSGASHGYVAAGGPGFSQISDTVGASHQ